MDVNFNHVSFTVKDIDRSIAFYCDLLGFTLEGIRYHVDTQYIQNIIGYPCAILHVGFVRCPGLRLEMIQYIRPQGVDLDKSTCNVGSAHICFNVNDIFAIYRELQDRDVIFRSEPVHIDSGPHKGAHAVYMLDPDGYTLELIQPPGGFKE